MLIKTLCNKLLLGRATSQLASCAEPSWLALFTSQKNRLGSGSFGASSRSEPSRAAASPSQLVELELFPALVLVVKAMAIIGAIGEAVVTCGHEVLHGTGSPSPEKSQPESGSSSSSEPRGP
jgi:hypothetical protein